MAKNRLKKICELFVSKRHPGVEIREFQVVETHQYNEILNKWEKDGNNAIFMIVQLSGPMKNLEIVEKGLEMITGCEVSIST